MIDSNVGERGRVQKCFQLLMEDDRDETEIIYIYLFDVMTKIVMDLSYF